MKTVKALRHSVFGFCLTVCLSATAALGGEAEIDAAKSVIDGQIRAFLAGDNDKAYAFAAPSIRQMFPSVDAFMSMVTRGYRPVWKPKRYSFGNSVEIDRNQIAQQVIVTGPDGKDYEAVYTLSLQQDGSYKITGVQLREAKSTGA